MYYFQLFVVSVSIYQNYPEFLFFSLCPLSGYSMIKWWLVELCLVFLPVFKNIQDCIVFHIFHMFSACFFLHKHIFRSHWSSEVTCGAGSWGDMQGQEVLHASPRSSLQRDDQRGQVPSGSWGWCRCTKQDEEWSVLCVCGFIVGGSFFKFKRCFLTVILLSFNSVFILLYIIYSPLMSDQDMKLVKCVKR